MVSSSSIGRCFQRLRAILDRVTKACAIVADEWRFRHAYPELRRALPVTADRPILLVNLTNWVPRAMLDGVLCKGLQLRGENPIVLSNTAFRTSQRRLRSWGLTHFLQLDEYLERAKQEWPDERIQQILPHPITFASLYSWTVGGVGVGRHVLSTVVRNLKKGTIQFDAPEVQEMLKHLLPQSVRTAAAAKIIMEELRPKTVLFLEKGYTPYGEIFDEALKSGAEVIQYFHAHRSDLLMMKRFTNKNRFVHPFSLSDESWEKVKDVSWSKDEEETFMKELLKSYEEGTWFNRKFLLKGKKSKTPEEVRSQLGLDHTKKTAVIFSHVLWDATFFFGENLFPDYETWLIETVKVACKNTAVNWIIKLHPDYVWKMQQMGPEASPRDIIALESSLGTLPEHIHVVAPDIDISTHAFFPITDYCITVRGTIGIEAPCFGIPVITAGTGRYSGLGFTHDYKKAQDYLDVLSHIQDIPKLTSEQTKLGRKHAWALFTKRPLPFTTCEIRAKADTNKLLDHEAVLRVQTLDDLKHAHDLQEFVDWIVVRHNEDYLQKLSSSSHS